MVKQIPGEDSKKKKITITREIKIVEKNSFQGLSNDITFTMRFKKN